MIRPHFNGAHLKPATICGPTPIAALMKLVDKAKYDSNLDEDHTAAETSLRKFLNHRATAPRRFCAERAEGG